jgi:hypothetical protein
MKQCWARKYSVQSTSLASVSLANSKYAEIFAHIWSLHSRAKLPNFLGFQGIFLRILILTAVLPRYPGARTSIIPNYDLQNTP